MTLVKLNFIELHLIYICVLRFYWEMCQYNNIIRLCTYNAISLRYNLCHCYINHLNGVPPNIVPLCNYRHLSTECERGTYGSNCEEDCGHCRDTGNCNITNGLCATGCEAWYMSDVCKVYISKSG